MELIKVHGSGNDFFILDQEKLGRKISETELKRNSGKDGKYQATSK